MLAAIRAFLGDDLGAETSEIALVLGILIVGGIAAWQFLKGQITSAVQSAGSAIGSGS